jgi:hypothetical protein
MSYDTRRQGEGWEARCRDCLEIGRADLLSALGGWMAAHKCPKQPKGVTT